MAPKVIVAPIGRFKSANAAHRPGFRFILPDGYSLATVGRAFAFVCPHHQSEPVADPEVAARAAWEHAGLPAPAVLKVAVR